MRRGALLLAAVAALWACAEPEVQEVPVEPSLLPGGYMASQDPDRSDPGVFTTLETPDGLRITTGPAGIAWRQRRK